MNSGTKSFYKIWQNGLFWRRVTAAVVIIVFTLFDAARYAPQGYASPPAVTVDPAPAFLSIPKELGLITERYEVPRTAYGAKTELETPYPVPRTVFFIQDAHDSLEAQENMAKIINLLVREKGIKTVFEEGYEGSVPTDKFFGFIKDASVKQKVSYFLLDKLRIGGAEYAHINRHAYGGRSTANSNGASLDAVRRTPYGDWQLIGVEDLKLYGENLSSYREASKSRKETGEDLGELFTRISNLADRYFPKALKTCLKVKERFEEGKLPLLNYLKELQAFYPEDRGPAIFVKNYPAVSLLLAAQTARDSKLNGQLNALDSSVVFGEIQRLERDISGAYLGTERERRIFTYSQALSLLQRLNRIELTQPEYEAVKETLQKFETQKLADFIVSLTHRSLVLSKEWERHIRDAVRFYEIALQRDGALAKALDNYLLGDTIHEPRATKQRKHGAWTVDHDADMAILVYGGFHANSIKELLRAKGISYAVITPAMTGIDKKHQEDYKQLMSVGHYSFEAPFLVTRANRPPSIFFSAAATGEETAARAELRAIESSVEALGDNSDSQLIERRLSVMPRSDPPRSLFEDGPVSRVARAEVREKGGAQPTDSDAERALVEKYNSYKQFFMKIPDLSLVEIQNRFTEIEKYLLSQPKPLLAFAHLPAEVRNAYYELIVAAYKKGDRIFARSGFLSLDQSPTLYKGKKYFQDSIVQVLHLLIDGDPSLQRSFRAKTGESVLAVDSGGQLNFAAVGVSILSMLVLNGLGPEDFTLNIIPGGPKVFATKATKDYRELKDDPYKHTLGNKFWHFPPTALLEQLSFLKAFGVDARFYDETDRMLNEVDGNTIISYGFRDPIRHGDIVTLKKIAVRCAQLFPDASTGPLISTGGAAASSRKDLLDYWVEVQGDGATIRRTGFNGSRPGARRLVDVIHSGYSETGVLNAAFQYWTHKERDPRYDMPRAVVDMPNVWFLDPFAQNSPASHVGRDMPMSTDALRGTITMHGLLDFRLYDYPGFWNAHVTPSSALHPKNTYFSHHAIEMTTEHGDCTTGCDFCGYTGFSKLHFKMPVGLVIDKIKRAKKAYPEFDYVIFNDGNFLSNLSWAREFFSRFREEILPSGVQGMFVQAPVYFLQDKNFLKLMKDSGVDILCVGQEGVTAEFLISCGKIKKGNEKLWPLFQMAPRAIAEAGIRWPRTSWILFHPKKDQNEVVATIEEVLRLIADNVLTFVSTFAMVKAGSKLFLDPQEWGRYGRNTLYQEIVPDKNDDAFVSHQVFLPEDPTLREVALNAIDQLDNHIARFKQRHSVTRDLPEQTEIALLFELVLTGLMLHPGTVIPAERIAKGIEKTKAVLERLLDRRQPDGVQTGEVRQGSRSEMRLSDGVYSATPLIEQRLSAFDQTESNPGQKSAAVLNIQSDSKNRAEVRAAEKKDAKVWVVRDPKTGAEKGLAYQTPLLPKGPMDLDRAWRDFHSMVFEFPKLLERAAREKLPVVLVIPEKLDGFGPLADEAPWIEGARTALAWASAYFRFKELGHVDVRVLQLSGKEVSQDRIAEGVKKILSRNIQDVAGTPEAQMEARIFRLEEVLKTMSTPSDLLLESRAMAGIAGAEKSDAVPEIIRPDLSPVPSGKKRIVITGAAGFIGINLVKRLLAEGHQVMALDSLISANKDFFSFFKDEPNFYFKQWDVSEPFDIEGPVDQVLHLASLASPPDYYGRPRETLRAGLQATREVMELARRKHARFFFTSTSEVYGDAAVHPQPETYAGNVSPFKKRSQYDQSKRGAETLMKLYAARYAGEGLDLRIVRIFNTYGPFMRIDDGRVITNFIEKVLQGKPIEIYGSDKITRSFGYVEDTVDGLLKLLRTDKLSPATPIQKKVFNIGNDSEFTLRELADLTNALGQKYLHRTVPVHLVGLKDPSDPVRRRPDLTRARTFLGYAPSIPLREGLEKTFLYFLNSRSEARSSLRTESGDKIATVRDETRSEARPDPKAARSETRESQDASSLKIEMQPLRHAVITLDGPSASGKGTVARLLARELGYLHMDLGVFYRAIAEKALAQKLDLTDEAAVKRLLEETAFEVRLKEGEAQVFRDGKEVTETIRASEVSNAAPVISKHSSVLRWVFQLARKIGESRDIVIEGRNAGTDIFPDSPTKFYLTTGIEERARRRFRDFEKAGTSMTLEQVQTDLLARDANDRNRSVAPFRKAGDAFEIDNTSLPAEKTAQKILEVVRIRQAIARYEERIKAILEQSPAEGKAWRDGEMIKAYYALMEGMKDAEKRAVYIYPFAGPDLIPDLLAKTYRINNDPRDVNRGWALLRQAFGRELSDLIQKNSRHDLSTWIRRFLGRFFGDKFLEWIQALFEQRSDVLDLSSYEKIRLENRPKILVLKGFYKFIKPARENTYWTERYAKGLSVAEFLLGVLLKRGDKVLLLDGEEEFFRGMLDRQGFRSLARSQGSIHPRKILEESKDLLIPNGRIAVYEKIASVTAATGVTGPRSEVRLPEGGTAKKNFFEASEAEWRAALESPTVGFDDRQKQRIPGILSRIRQAIGSGELFRPERQDPFFHSLPGMNGRRIYAFLNQFDMADRRRLDPRHPSFDIERWVRQDYLESPFTRQMADAAEREVLTGAMLHRLVREVFQKLDPDFSIDPLAPDTDDVIPNYYAIEVIELLKERILIPRGILLMHPLQDSSQPIVAKITEKRPMQTLTGRSISILRADVPVAEDFGEAQAYAEYMVVPNQTHAVWEEMAHAFATSKKEYREGSLRLPDFLGSPFKYLSYQNWFFMLGNTHDISGAVKAMEQAAIMEEASHSDAIDFWQRLNGRGHNLLRPHESENFAFSLLKKESWIARVLRDASSEERDLWGGVVVEAEGKLNAIRSSDHAIAGFLEAIISVLGRNDRGLMQIYSGQPPLYQMTFNAIAVVMS
jgi:cytidylate kinase